MSNDIVATAAPGLTRARRENSKKATVQTDTVRQKSDEKSDVVTYTREIIPLIFCFLFSAPSVRFLQFI